MTLSVKVNIQDQVGHTGREVVDTLKSTSPSEKVKLSIKAITLARYIGSSSKKMLANGRHLPVVGALKLMKLPLIPLSLHAIKSAFSSKNTLTGNEKIDRGLDVAASIGTVGDTVVSLGEGLKALGAVTSHAIWWATPLVVVSAVLEAAGLILLVKTMLETRRFSRLFEQASGSKKPNEVYTLEDFTRVRLMIEEKSQQEASFISKHLKTDGKRLNKRLEQIDQTVQRLLSSSDEQEVLKGQRQLQTTMETLKGRIKTKQQSAALSILTGVVSLVAFGLLFTPAGLVGYGLLAGSGAVSLGNFFNDKAKTRQFEQTLGLKDA